MLSKLDAIVVFDLENCVYLAKNRLLSLIRQGELDHAVCFSDRQLSEPVSATILSVLRRKGIDSSIVIKVVSKESEYLLATFSRCKFRVAKDKGFNNGPGSQAADLEIRNILDHLYKTLPIDMSVILVSGDGGFISSMQKLIEKGHSALIVSPEWGLNGAYYSELGEDFVISLPPDWINEVIRLTVKQLPHAE